MDSSCIPSFRFIPLVYQGLTVIVTIDRSFYPVFSLYKWNVLPAKGNRTFYCYAKVRKEGGTWKTVYLHRLILGIVDDPTVEGEHRNHDGLDNRLVNLRRASRTENCRNMRTRQNKLVPYKGVMLTYPGAARKKYNIRPFQANIIYGGKRHYLGSFDTAEEAARAYDTAAKRIFGEFAHLNFKTETSIG